MAFMKKETPAEKMAMTVSKSVKENPKTATAAGLVAATAVGAALWLTTRRHATSDGIALHVESDGDSGWVLRQEGIEEPIARHESKRRAVSAAREFAREHGPSALAIHKRNGAVGRRHIYAGD